MKLDNKAKQKFKIILFDRLKFCLFLKFEYIFKVTKLIHKKNFK